MNCNDARRRFSVYLDRDLTLGQEEDLRLHLAACPDCRDEMTRLEQVLGLVHSLPETQPDPNFYAAIRRRIAESVPGAEVDREPERTSLGDFIRAALSPLRLRPAAGLALGLVAGIVIGAGGMHLSERPGMPAPGSLAAGGPSGPAAVTGEGPLDDLDLSHLRAGGDSLRMEDEYVLEPYVTDPLRGLVPEANGYQRRVSGGDGNEPREVYITF